jgi:hypothetical protein
MTTFTIADSVKTINLTAGTLTAENPVIGQLLTVLGELNVQLPLASVTLVGAAITVTFKSTNVIVVTVAALGPPIVYQINVGSTVQWTQLELDLIFDMCAIMAQMYVNNGLTAATITYA